MITYGEVVNLRKKFQENAMTASQNAGQYAIATALMAIVEKIFSDEAAENKARSERSP